MNPKEVAAHEFMVRLINEKEQQDAEIARLKADKAELLDALEGMVETFPHDRLKIRKDFGSFAAYSQAQSAITRAKGEA